MTTRRTLTTIAAAICTLGLLVATITTTAQAETTPDCSPYNTRVESILRDQANGLIMSAYHLAFEKTGDPDVPLVERGWLADLREQGCHHPTWTIEHVNAMLAALVSLPEAVQQHIITPFPSAPPEEPIVEDQEEPIIEEEPMIEKDLEVLLFPCSQNPPDAPEDYPCVPDQVIDEVLPLIPPFARQ